jgi:Rod binding domain-containing protein
MDSTKLFFNEPISSQVKLNDISQVSSASDAKNKDVAKNFESIFINKLFEEMKNTVPEGEGCVEDDGTNGQVNGIFSTYMSEHLSNNGGMGFWKDIYKFFSETKQSNIANNSLDDKI